eukprot:6182304-Pleurochrysis_carterae.AAC.2
MAYQELILPAVCLCSCLDGPLRALQDHVLVHGQRLAVESAGSESLNIHPISRGRRSECSLCESGNELWPHSPVQQLLSTWPTCTSRNGLQRTCDQTSAPAGHTTAGNYDERREAVQWRGPVRPASPAPPASSADPLATGRKLA